MHEPHSPTDVEGIALATRKVGNNKTKVSINFINSDQNKSANILTDSRFWNQCSVETNRSFFESVMFFYAKEIKILSTRLELYRCKQAMRSKKQKEEKERREKTERNGKERKGTMDTREQTSNSVGKRNNGNRLYLRDFPKPGMDTPRKWKYGSKYRPVPVRSDNI
ncbi:hypothetical protein WN51_04488 [Melipona quadrifasciata]|uniref:Uncharacterized protein n=1 Tax=Melipona quadrifasciata TaxID=166423 RepID=A0A0M8ZUN9_9HYME|nr:hypothetical protein WN51_04488 [Melipona quadrifasciata]